MNQIEVLPPSFHPIPEQRKNDFFTVGTKWTLCVADPLQATLITYACKVVVDILQKDHGLWGAISPWTWSEQSRCYRDISSIGSSKHNWRICYGTPTNDGLKNIKTA